MLTCFNLVYLEEENKEKREEIIMSSFFSIKNHCPFFHIEFSVVLLYSCVIIA